MLTIQINELFRGLFPVCVRPLQPYQDDEFLDDAVIDDVSDE